MGFSVILNVDGREPERSARSTILREAGLEVREAAGGEEALRMAAESRPDLVLLEANLPDISSFEVCRRLRESRFLKHVPVIHISEAYAVSEDRMAGDECGAEAYLTEPVEPGVLATMVKSLVHSSQCRRKLEWLLEPRPRSCVPEDPPYGDLRLLNTHRVLADAVPEAVLRDAVSNYLDLLDTSSTVYEASGEYVLDCCSSRWCRLLKRASRELCGTTDNREALASGHWLCHEACWGASMAAIAARQPADHECPGGIRTYAMPVLAGDEVAGSMAFCYGDPPDALPALAEIANRYHVSVEELVEAAAAYESRPPFIVEAAKRRLLTSARLVGALVERNRAEAALRESCRIEQSVRLKAQESADRLERLQTVTAALGEAVTSDQVLDAIITRVMSATGAVAGILALLNEDETVFRTVRIAGYPEETARRAATFPAAPGNLLADAALARQAILLDNADDPRYPMLTELGPRFPTGGVAAVPFALRGRVLGALGLRLAPGRPFTIEDWDFFLTVGRECAQALERARLYEEVTSQKQRLEEIFNALPAYVAIYSGPDHVLEYSNPENTRMWGGRNPVGKPIRQAYPEIGEEQYRLWDQAFRSGEPVYVPASPANVDPGTGKLERRFLDIFLLPRRNGAGEVSGVMAFGVDVTGQVHTHRELERQRAFVEAVLEQMPLGVVLAEAPSEKLLLFNRQGGRILGHPVQGPGELVDYERSYAIHPDGSPGRPEEHALARALRRGEVIDQEEWLYRRGDGSIATLAVSAAPIRNGDGHMVAAVCTFQDITERRRERDTLRLQSQMINLSRDAIIAADPERVITGWNRGAEETYGWTAAEAIGRPTRALLATASYAPPEEIDAVLMREGRWEGELQHVRKDGAVIIVESRQALVRDERGHPAGILEINRDITQRKSAEEALRESERWLKFSQEAAGVGLRDWDLTTNLSRCSEQFLRFYGLDPERHIITSEEWIERVHPEDRQPTLEKIAAALEGRIPYELEFRAVRPDGAVRWIASKAAIFRDNHGKAVRLIGAHIDITERKRAEEAHFSAQKLESIGLLAGGIAHDFNNLLTGILGNASLVLPELSQPQAERVEAIVTGAQKAADLTRQLLAYAGKGRFVVRQVDLAVAVMEMTELLRVSIPRHVELHRSLQPAPVQADAGQIQQLVMNLAINAAEAVGEAHGSVTVATGIEEFSAPLSGSLGEELPPGRYAYLEVADNGSGMDEETRSRIFDPFYTTKFLGRGLGLAAVAGIVRSHNGAINIRTAPGRGSVFRVFLPAAEEPRPAQKAGVLVVDDEDAVRDFLRRVLEARGYTVTCAANGREALAELDRRGREISLVVLDVVMPVMSGGEMLAELRSRRPGLKVLLTSGYSEDEVHRICGPECQKAGFIQKPYTAQQVADKVKAELER